MTSGDRPRTVQDISWREFEELVGEYFRRQGFSVRENETGGPDGGVDLELKRGNELFLVQCKQWKAFNVSVSIVRELYGVMAARGAAGGYVVTTGAFTRDALAFARGTNIQLLDGEKISTLNSDATKEKEQKTAEVPDCPICSNPMVRRVAKQGQYKGKRFWGCQEYPGCRGIRQ